MYANIQTTTQGVKGGKTHKQRSSYTSIEIDNTHEISMDCFEGTGTDYKRREQTVISIKNLETGKHINLTPADLNLIIENGTL